jgi:DNA (cytosine-5)-methyltransferase 1
LEVGDFDVLLGGPPCQGYSLNSHIRSAEDPRNHLFRQYVRLLHGLSPKVFVLENVPGMLSLSGGCFFDELLSSIRNSTHKGCPGYEIDFKILNAAHYGVPQERFRVVVIGTRRDIAQRVGKARVPRPVYFSFAQAHFKGGRAHTFHYAIGHGVRHNNEPMPLLAARLLPPLTVGAAIGDLPPLTNGGGQNYKSTYDIDGNAMVPTTPYQLEMRNGAEALSNHWCRELLPPNTERVKYIRPGGDWRCVPRHLLSPGMQRALRKDHTTRYGRLSPDHLAGTLLTKPDPHWGAFLHYDVVQQRLISVREAARLQSFPDSQVFYGSQVDQYKLCGNAVPPLMAQAVAAEVKQVLDKFYGYDTLPRDFTLAQA